MVKKLKDDPTYSVSLTTETNSWVGGWDDAPLHVTAIVTDTSSNKSVNEANVIFTLEGAKGDFVDGGVTTTDAKGIARGKVVITEASEANVTATITVDVTTIDGGSCSASVKLHVRPSVLRAPYFPLANDGLIDEADVAAGVFGQILISDGSEGDIVCMYFDDVKIEHTMTTSSEKIQMPVIETLLTTGKHTAGYYHLDYVGNASFSSQAEIYVQRDGASGIFDLPKPSVPAADVDGSINESDMDNIDIMVVVDGLYGDPGVPVFSQISLPSDCVMHLNSFDKSGNLVEDASYNASLTIDNNTAPPTFHIPPLTFKTLGEGTMTVTYELTLIDGKLHTSRPNTFIVDVIPPGGRKNK